MFSFFMLTVILNTKGKKKLNDQKHELLNRNFIINYHTLNRLQKSFDKN